MIAEINTWEQKRNIMNKKKELEKGLIINNLTKKRKRNTAEVERNSKGRKRKRK